MADLTLYTNPMSRGRIVRWMLEEVGAPYRTEWVAYGEAIKAPAYRAINPMGKVPAIRHGEVVVTECAAICAYLADAFPEAGLAPALDARGTYYRWLFFAAGPLEASSTDLLLGAEPKVEQRAMVGYGTRNDVLDTLELAVSGAAFIAGPHFTAADVYVGAQIGWGLQFGSIDARPAFTAYWSRVSHREAYRRAAAVDDAAMAGGGG